MKRQTYLAGAAALALLIAVPVTAAHQSHGLRGSFSGQGVSGQSYVAAGSWQHQRLQAQLSTQHNYESGHGAHAAPAQGQYYVAQPAHGYTSAPQYVRVETTPKKKKKLFGKFIIHHLKITFMNLINYKVIQI